VPFTLRKIKNRHTTKTKHNLEKANNAKDSKTKLSWLNLLTRYSAMNVGGLILQYSWAYMGFHSRRGYWISDPDG